MSNYIFTTNKNLPLSRLDKILAELSNWSRSKAQQYVKENRVSVNKIIINDSNYKVYGSNEIEVNLPISRQSTYLIPQEIPLDIYYEDADLLVINKPAGMTVHPGNGTHNDTLVNALLDHCGETLSNINGEQRPGIVHRIDRDTTGLLLVAKNDEAHRNLAKQIAERTAERHYLALVWGVPHPLQGVISTRIGHSRTNRTKMTVLNHGGKEAVTYYEVKQVLSNNLISLVECRLKTGRTHQLRVHLSHKGNSIVGDQIYGNHLGKIRLYNRNEVVRDSLEMFQRQALHAYFLSFTHPVFCKRMAFTAKLPSDFQGLYELLRG